MNRGDTIAAMLGRAIALHRSGQVAPAEAIYLDIVRRDRRAWQAHYYLGLIVAGRNELVAAAGHFEQATRIEPQFLEGYFNRGVVLTGLGRLQEALESYRTAVRLRPDYVDASYNAAGVLMMLKRFAEALDGYDQLLRFRPAYPEALNNRGNVLKELGRIDEAIVSFEQAILFRPDYAEAWTSRGAALCEAQRFDEAAACHGRALSINPDFALAHYNLGCALRGLGHLAPALASLDRAIAIAPGFAEAWSGRALVLGSMNRLEEAVVSCERAVAIDPRQPQLRLVCGLVLGDYGAAERASAHLDQIISTDPQHVEARFASCFVELPAVYSNVGEIAVRRETYERKLRALCADAASGRLKGDLVKAASHMQPFFLAYQGQNDRELQRLYGSLLCSIMARRFPEAVLPPPPAPDQPVRVGFVSAFFRNHSVWKAPLQGWIKMLDRRRFRLFGYNIGTDRDAVTEAAASVLDRFVDRRLSLDAWRAEILSDAPHVLIYPGLLMDPLSVQLASQRLAPVQCNSWGHPETSGLDTVDYFLSSDLMEPPDGDEHYVERLVRLPNLSIFYEPVESEPSSTSRATLGLRPGATVFWSGQSLYKYLPQFDHVFPRIAKEVEDSQFVFIRHAKSDHITTRVQERLEGAFAAFGVKCSDHCVFLQSLTQAQFGAAIGQCDLVLDTPDWSGCNSTLESLNHDLPIVTLSGRFMRSRHTAAILRMMGIEDTIADSIENYIATAVRLAKDIDYRRRQKERIAANKHRLYRDRACVEALEDFLDRVARAAAPPAQDERHV